MTLMICQGCTTAYGPGAPCCPHCGGTDAVEEHARPDVVRPTNSAEVVHPTAKRARRARQTPAPAPADESEAS